MLHELWVDASGFDMFCLAGGQGDEVRSMLDCPAQLVWTVEAGSHFEAMTAYYRYRGFGAYTTDNPEWDCKTYHQHGWE